MKKTNKNHYFLISLISILLVTVGYVFYIGLFSSFHISENKKSGIVSKTAKYPESTYLTNHYLDDFYMSLLLEEGIVTQRGIGSNRAGKIVPGGQIVTTDTDDYKKLLEDFSGDNNYQIKRIANIDRYGVPERLPSNARFQITLQKANAYPVLRNYLEANNLPDTLRVMRIFDNNKKRALYILSVEPLG